MRVSLRIIYGLAALALMAVAACGRLGGGEHRHAYLLAPQFLANQSYYQNETGLLASLLKAVNAGQIKAKGVNGQDLPADSLALFNKPAGEGQSENLALQVVFAGHYNPETPTKPAGLLLMRILETDGKGATEQQVYLDYEDLTKFAGNKSLAIWHNPYNPADSLPALHALATGRFVPGGVSVFSNDGKRLVTKLMRLPAPVADGWKEPVPVNDWYTVGGNDTSVNAGFDAQMATTAFAFVQRKAREKPLAFSATVLYIVPAPKLAGQMGMPDARTQLLQAVHDGQLPIYNDSLNRALSKEEVMQRELSATTNAQGQQYIILTAMPDAMGLVINETAALGKDSVLVRNPVALALTVDKSATDFGYNIPLGYIKMADAEAKLGAQHPLIQAIRNQTLPFSNAVVMGRQRGVAEYDYAAKRTSINTLGLNLMRFIYQPKPDSTATAATVPAKGR